MRPPLDETTETGSDGSGRAGGTAGDETAGDAAGRGASGDAPEYDAADRYWVVREAVEDALMNVFWTLALLGFGLALLAGGALAVLENGGSRISVLVGVALVGLGVGNVAVALDVRLPFVSAD
ncbi:MULTISPECIES: hypothetical protein [Halorubrum]|uniref:Uncharacterized protein n=1 Tax=Halorubrum tropicale TaxID=1765655 RepID=A0A0M9AVA8_9EURY|nr:MULTISPECIES: hypothetical protein [Halorubrum]KOX98231.1 hypothetical protein AMR74_04895 [Halorubrum tropicale]TKX45394.1 hypothetical protein EXE50_05400 [Halorubrum sp. ARQ200]TKX51433.1 hypothetical protein EXE49_00645 [Halorubrum sp. ASP121]TKX58408.1 hypothetical protein EXE48_16560 [Halorubrum sp. ASP1]